MTRAVGLDLGSRYAKAVLVEKNAAGAALLSFAVVEAPAAGPDPAFIRDLLARVRWNYEPLAVSLRAHDTGVREVVVPFTDPKHLDQVVRFEAENFLPFPVEETTLDFVSLGREEENTRVLVFAARKQQLAQRLGLLEAAEIDPYLVGIEPLALVEAYAATAEDPAPPALLLDLGASAVTAVCTQDGAARHVRILRLGEAEGRKQDDPLPATYTHRLGRELHRFLASLPDGQAPGRAWLTGGNAGPDAARAIEAALGFPVELAMDSSGGRVSGEVNGLVRRQGMLALGLALSLAGPARAVADLRKGEFRYRPRIERLRAPLSFFLAAGICFLALCAAGIEWRFRNVQRAARAITAREHALWQSVGADARRPADLAAWVDGELRRVQAEAPGGRSGQPQSAFVLLRTILSAIPPKLDVSVRSVHISPERARIEMAAASHTDAAEIVKVVGAKTALVVNPRNLRYEASKSVFDLEAATGRERSHVE